VLSAKGGFQLPIVSANCQLPIVTAKGGYVMARAVTQVTLGNRAVTERERDNQVRNPFN